MKNNLSHLKVSLIFKFISLIGSIYGLIFTVEGLNSFTFYTTLSNITIDIALVVFIVLDLLIIFKQKDFKSNGFYIYKYMMTVAISLTFLVYMFILAPTYDCGILYSYFHHYAGSFGVHFIGPVFAILDYLLFDYNHESKAYHCVYATIPPLCYVVFVVLLANSGYRWYGNMYAPYNFLNFGATTGWFGFDLSLLGSETLGIGVAYLIIVLLIIFLALGFSYLKIKDIRKKKINSK